MGFGCAMAIKSPSVATIVTGRFVLGASTQTMRPRENPFSRDRVRRVRCRVFPGHNVRLVDLGRADGFQSGRVADGRSVFASSGHGRGGALDVSADAHGLVCDLWCGCDRLAHAADALAVGVFDVRGSGPMDVRLLEAKFVAGLEGVWPAVGFFFGVCGFPAWERRPIKP